MQQPNIIVCFRGTLILDWE